MSASKQDSVSHWAYGAMEKIVKVNHIVGMKPMDLACYIIQMYEDLKELGVNCLFISDDDGSGSGTMAVYEGTAQPSSLSSLLDLLSNVSPSAALTTNSIMSTPHASAPFAVSVNILLDKTTRSTSNEEVEGSKCKEDYHSERDEEGSRREYEKRKCAIIEQSAFVQLENKVVMKKTITIKEEKRAIKLKRDACAKSEIGPEILKGGTSNDVDGFPDIAEVGQTAERIVDSTAKGSTCCICAFGSSTIRIEPPYRPSNASTTMRDLWGRRMFSFCFQTDTSPEHLRELCLFLNGTHDFLLYQHFFDEVRITEDASCKAVSHTGQNKMAAVFDEILQDASFEAFVSEFTREGFVAPEGLLCLLKTFKLKPQESPEEGRSRLYKRLWALLCFGSNKSLGGHLGKPTYVFPSSLKRVVREFIPGDLVSWPDPSHERNDSDPDVTDKIAATSAPCLNGCLSLQKISILNAVVTLIASYFTFIADYPKCYMQECIFISGVYLNPQDKKKQSFTANKCRNSSGQDG
ncbi:hypothetical protein ACROYT_G015552 [Oculina patagonica]